MLGLITYSYKKYLLKKAHHGMDIPFQANINEHGNTLYLNVSRDGSPLQYPSVQVRNDD